MFVINVFLQVQNPEKAPEICELLRQAGKLSREEPGCLQFEVCQDEADASQFILCERWETKQDWETHKLAEAFTTIYQPQVLPHVTRTPHFCRIIE